MLMDEIERLRQYLNTLVLSNDLCSEEVLKVSKELDLLIMKYVTQSPP